MYCVYYAEMSTYVSFDVLALPVQILDIAQIILRLVYDVSSPSASLIYECVSGQF